MPENSLYALLVIYNKNLADSQSFQSAQKQEGLNLIVLDNSTEPNDNAQTAKRAGVSYLCMQENAGLSRAYNRGIQEIRKQDPNLEGTIVLLDDDTELNDKFWKEVRKIQKHKYRWRKDEPKEQIFLPVVKTEKGSMISPCEIEKGVPRQVKNLKKIKEISGINSGMVIPLELFHFLHFDEDLFLDNVDHQFLWQAKKMGVPIKVMEAEVIQQFSAEDPDIESKKRRFETFKKDTRHFYKEDPLTGRFVINKRRIRLLRQTKDPYFLK